MKLILSYIRRHLRMFLTAIFFLSVETFADLLQPTFMAHVVDDGVKGQDIAAILRYGAVMLAIAATGAVGAVLRNRYASKTSQQIGKELRGDMYRKVQTLSFENVDRLQPAAIITRITNDVTQIQNFVNGTMRIMMKVPITLVGAVILILVQTPRLFPVVAVIVTVSVVLILANMKLGYPRYGRLQQKLDKLNTVSREFLSSVRVVKAFGAENEEKEKFSDAAEGFARSGISATRVLAIFSPLINLTVNFAIVILLWISQAQPAGQIGRLMASVNYMTQVLFALSMISNILNSSVRALASAERVQKIFDEEPAQKTAPDTLHPQIRGSVSFQDVSFSYAGASGNALSHITFDALPGETIGIIGPTGSGKSSLVNLVPRFYDATGGKVLVDGCDVTMLAPEELRKSVAVVPQKALLFSDTIAGNLRWGDSAATDKTVQEAACAACADEFICRLPQKYETSLGQGGVNLSGGQKQRLSLARALLRKPRILILDDCTSALDASTEAQVLQNLRSATGSATVLLISQRISTVMRADKIICLEEGELRGFGTHRQLMDICPAYRAIYASQIGADDEEKGGVL